jgi:hypothetical protein
MKKPRSKTPDPMVPNPELETQMKAAMEAPTQAIVQVGDARVEQIKKSNGDTRIAVRAASGRFSKMTTAVAHADAKQAQQFLLEKVTNEAGVELSRKQHLRVALFDGAIAAAKEPRALGNSVKAFAELNSDASLTQQKEAMVTAANQEENHPVRVVVINCPANMMHPTELNYEEELRKREAKKQPSFAEVTGYTTNPQEQ